MSLNKFSNTDIGSDLKLEAGLSKLVVDDEATIRGNIIPNNITTAGFVLSNVDGNGTLGWVADNGAGGDVSFTGIPPVQVGEVVVYSAIDGESIQESGVLLTDLVNDVNTNTADISTLQNQVSDNTAEISILKPEVQQNTTDIITLQNDVNTNTADITTLQNNKYDKTGGPLSGNVDLQNNNILQVNNINLSTINNAVYPPLSTQSDAVSVYYYDNETRYTINMPVPDPTISNFTLLSQNRNGTNYNYGFTLTPNGFRVPSSGVYQICFGVRLISNLGMGRIDVGVATGTSDGNPANCSPQTDGGFNSVVNTLGNTYVYGSRHNGVILKECIAGDYVNIFVCGVPLGINFTTDIFIYDWSLSAVKLR